MKLLDAAEKGATMVLGVTLPIAWFDRLQRVDQARLFDTVVMGAALYLLLRVRIRRVEVEVAALKALAPEVHQTGEMTRYTLGVVRELMAAAIARAGVQVLAPSGATQAREWERLLQNGDDFLARLRPEK